MNKESNLLDERMLTRIYSQAIENILDWNILSCDIYEGIRSALKSGSEILKKPIDNGLLYIVSKYSFEKYLDINYIDEIMISISLKNEVDPEYLFWYYEDYINFIYFHEIPADDQLKIQLDTISKKAEALFTSDEKDYYSYLDSKYSDILNLLDKIWEEYNQQILLLLNSYSFALSNMLFNERMICSWLNKALAVIDLTSGLEIKRVAFGEKVSKCIKLRDRFRCVECNKDLMDPQNVYHIDHIIPLANGGNNDISNLQLLCDKCNLKKGKNIKNAPSPYPEYFRSPKASKRK